MEITQNGDYWSEGGYYITKYGNSVLGIRSTSGLLVAQHIILLVLSWCPTSQVTEIQVTLCSVLRSGGWNNIVTFLLCSVGKWWILCLGDWVWSKNGETNSVASNLIDGQKIFYPGANNLFIRFRLFSRVCMIRYRLQI